MASNTPNLNLLKKDPVTDGNDTFNIRTMLNENWDKIDAAVGEVREELQDIEIPDASLTQAGIVQLSNEINGSRENVAATEKAVSRAFQAGNERKAEVVAALVALGVSASTSETWAQLIPKMASIIRATGNAAAADLLAGKTASNASGPFTGTMPDRGAITITPSGTAAVTIPDGAYKGAKVAQVSVPAAKVLNDTAIAGIAGTMPNQGTKTSTITTQGGQYTIPAGYHNGAGKITASFANLVAGNVKSGVNIGGVMGTLAPDVFGSVDVNVTTGAPIPAGSALIPIVTLPAGVRYISFVSSTNWSSYINYLSGSSGIWTFLRLKNANTGVNFDISFTGPSSWMPTVYLSKVVVDIPNNTAYVIDYNKGTEWRTGYAASDLTSAPIDIFLYHQNENVYNGEAGKIVGKFSYA